MVISVTVNVAGRLQPTAGVRFSEVGYGVDGRVKVVVVGYKVCVRRWLEKHGYDPKFYEMEIES